MKVIIKENENQVAEYAYENVVKPAIVEKEYKVLGLPTGSSPLKLYAQIAAGFKRGEIDFSDISTFNLDEYIGLPADHPQSYRLFMETNLFQHINLKPSNIHFLNGMTDCVEWECDYYEEAMEALGGIKLQILGIGRDGHIGFNEPGTPLDCRTGYVTLAEETIEDNKRFFECAADVPRWALSMGVGTIMDAQEILMIATGANKADAIAGMIEGPITAMNTASILQKHPNVTVVIDEAAASKLTRKEYYKKTADNYDEMYEFLMAARVKAGLED